MDDIQVPQDEHAPVGRMSWKFLEDMEIDESVYLTMIGLVNKGVFEDRTRIACSRASRGDKKFSVKKEGNGITVYRTK